MARRRPRVNQESFPRASLAGWIRDEIRMIEPRFYLGQVFGGRTRLFHFALQF